MNTSLQIKTLTRDDILTHLDALADILELCQGRRFRQFYVAIQYR